MNMNLLYALEPYKERIDNPEEFLSAYSLFEVMLRMRGMCELNKHKTNATYYEYEEFPKILKSKMHDMFFRMIQKNYLVDRELEEKMLSTYFQNLEDDRNMDERECEFNEQYAFTMVMEIFKSEVLPKLEK